MNIRKWGILVVGGAIIIVSGLAYATETNPPFGSIADQVPISSDAEAATPDPTGSVLQITIQGPVVANELYNSATITVSAGTRVATVYQTYTSQVVFQQTFANNDQALAQFRSALQTAGFTSKARSSRQATVGSTCPTGLRYTYTIMNAGQIVFTSWATSCGTLSQSSTGNIGLINQLFFLQIPNLNQITQFAPFSP
ncbi:MAG TPA: hypothetical protein VMS08_05140 [Candidatus Saccharimonadia bacterium]|nr:hypothetical protein [Candidatus Saccharimonadia bacterium]